VTGKAGVEELERFGLTANKNAIPFDTRPPMVTSGYDSARRRAPHVASPPAIFVALAN
jgi:hypothetical protein